MFTKEEIELVKNELPDRAMTQLAIETGISRPTIYRFFEGKKIKSYMQEQIYLAALKIIDQYQKKKNHLLKKTELVFSRTPSRH